MTRKAKFRPDMFTRIAVLANMRPNREEDADGRVRKIGRCLRRGMGERRIIAQAKIDGIEYAYHATKGWRRRPIDWVAR